MTVQVYVVYRSRVVEADFTPVGVNSALDQFIDLARQLRQEPDEQGLCPRNHVWSRVRDERPMEERAPGPTLDQ